MTLRLKGGSIFSIPFRLRLFCRLLEPCEFKKISKLHNRHNHGLKNYYAFCIFEGTCNQKSSEPIVVDPPKISFFAPIADYRGKTQ